MSRSILEPRGEKCCYLCGETRNTEEHHIFFGPMRRKSEHFGLKVHLCIPHHRGNTPECRGVHFNRELDLWLKMQAQQAFEERYDHGRFMEEFGKNYIDREINDTARGIHAGDPGPGQNGGLTEENHGGKNQVPVKRKGVPDGFIMLDER